MIANFSDPATEDVFNGVDSRRARQTCGRLWWPMAIRKLTQLNRIRYLDELCLAPRNKVVLHPERGPGHARIRVSEGDWIHFRWEEGRAEEGRAMEGRAEEGRAMEGRAEDVEFGRASPSIGRTTMTKRSRTGVQTDGDDGYPHSGEARSEHDGYPRLRRPLPTHRPPMHPGEMLRLEFLKPRGITQGAFAVQLGISFARLNEVINAKRAVTPDTALRLARVTGMSADFWLGLQMDWDLWHALRSDEAKEIAKLEPLPLRTVFPTTSPASSPCWPR